MVMGNKLSSDIMNTHMTNTSSTSAIWVKIQMGLRISSPLTVIIFREFTEQEEHQNLPPRRVNDFREGLRWDFTEQEEHQNLPPRRVNDFREGLRWEFTEQEEHQNLPPRRVNDIREGLR
jgi:hypothetical protein